MAKVLNPLLSTHAIGTTSGVTYKGFRGMDSALRKAQPVRRLRNIQGINRANIGWMARSWGGLSALNRDDWKAWADSHPIPDGFGGTFRMTGMNAFISLNQKKMVNIGGGYVPAPPIMDLQVGMAGLIVTAGVNPGEATLTWTVNGSASASDRVVVAVAGPYYSPARNPGPKDYHTCFGSPKVNHAVAGNLLTYVVTGLVPGAQYWFAVHYVQADGQASSKVVGQGAAHV